MTEKIQPADYRIVPLSERHGQGVMEIFNFYITESHAAFPDKPVPEAFFDRFLEMSRGYPALAVMADDIVVGFGFLRPYHWAETFGRTAEITYFLRPKHTRQGLGTTLLESLCQQAEQQAIEVIVASLSSRNLASLAFHLKNGFEICGTLKQVGKKFGQDFDVVIMQKQLTRTAVGLEQRIT
jgi:L-amino acid N-acyltransferase YncA